MRELAYDQLHVDYRQTALERGELIVRVRVPARAADAIHLFRKVGTRAALAISVKLLLRASVTLSFQPSLGE